MKDHKRLQGAARHWQTRTLVQILICAGLITVGAVFYVWQRWQYISLGFDVAGLRTRAAALERRLEPLEVEVDYLTRPERIDAIAQQRLGLHMPVPSQIIVVDTDGPVPAERR